MGDALKIALVTVSDTRTAENDTSGDYLADALSGVGHELVDRVIVIDDCYLFARGFRVISLTQWFRLCS